jgi:hypothetical protein
MNSSKMIYLILSLGIILFSFFNLFAQRIKIETITWQGEKVEVVKGTIIVKLADPTGKAQFKNDIASLNFKVIHEPDKQGIAVLHIPQDETIENSFEKLKKIENLQYIEPDFVDRLFVTPNDTYYSNQWAHPKINSPSAWDIETGSNSILTVSSGITLQLNSGVTLKMASGKKLAVNGTIDADNVTFESQSGSWYGIEFINASSNSQIWYCTIEDATVGIHLNNTGLFLGCNEINNNTTGLLFNSGSDGKISNSEI